MQKYIFKISERDWCPPKYNIIVKKKGISEPKYNTIVKKNGYWRNQSRSSVIKLFFIGKGIRLSQTSYYGNAGRYTV